MAHKSDYYREKEILLATKLDDLKGLLPDFANSYLESKGKAQTSTLVAYARDLHTFFVFLCDKNPVIAQKGISEITLNDMKMITPKDLIEYIQYLGLSQNHARYSNYKNAIARKFAPLNGLYTYYMKQREIEYNPVNAIEIPREAEDKTKIKLKDDDVSELLYTIQHDNTAYGDRKRVFKDKNRIRDYTIMRLLCDTGIRISELVGLDVTSINFKRNEMIVVRKGGGLDEILLNPATTELILEYMEVYRSTIKPKLGHEDALFYSLQGKRISVSSIEKMTKEYGLLAVPGKKVTPHSMRGAYGTALYEVTGDIELVADVLGHKSIETTRRNYINRQKKHKEKAATIGPIFASHNM